MPKSALKNSYSDNFVFIFTIFFLLLFFCNKHLVAKEAISSTIATKECPFLKGKDEPHIKNILEQSLNQLERVASKCKAIKNPTEDFSMAIASMDKYQASLGFKGGEIDEKAKPSLPSGYTKIPINCSNYDIELPREWHIAKKRRASGRPSYGIYDKECANQIDLQAQYSCMDQIFWENFFRVKSFCTGRAEEIEKTSRNKLLTDGYAELRRTAQALIEQSKGCEPEVLSDVIRYTVATLNSFGPLNSVTGVAGLGLSLGGDTVALITKYLSGHFAVNRRLKGEQARQARDQLFCTYLDAEYYSNQCKSDAARPKNPILGETPKAVSDFYQGSGKLFPAKKLTKLLQAVQAQEPKELLNIKNVNSPLKALGEALKSVTIDPQSNRRIRVIDFLQQVSIELLAASPKEIQATHVVGEQLKNILKSYSEYEKGTGEGAMNFIESIKSKKAEGLPEQPPFDLDFALSLYFGLPGKDVSVSNGLQNLFIKDAFEKSSLELKDLDEKLKEGLKYQQDDLDWSFTSLWASIKPELLNEISSSHNTFTKHQANKSLLSDPSDKGKEMRAQHFWANIYPLVRACLAFRGAAHYTGDSEGSPISNKKKANYSLALPIKRNLQYDRNCQQIACLEPPFSGNDAQAFRASQCRVLENLNDTVNTAFQAFKEHGNICPATNLNRSELIEHQKRNPSLPRPPQNDDGIHHDNASPTKRPIKEFIDRVIRR